MRASVVILGSILFLTGVAGGVALTARLQTPDAPAGAVPVPDASSALVAQAPSTPPATPLVGGPDFTSVAEAIVPAVTNISSRQVVQQRTAFGNDPFFRYFFGDSRELSGYSERPASGRASSFVPMATS